MCMNSKRQAGFTLIELIIFIVVVSVGLLGILSVMNLTVQHSADPMVRKQAAALADSILEEILLKDYVDPDGGVNLVEGSPTPDRTLFDDVDDYNGLSNAVFGLRPELSLYVIGITVAPDAITLPGVAAKRVTVTVTRGNESVSMTGYRANY
jgi:MSHA pilin protein MshD